MGSLSTQAQKKAQVYSPGPGLAVGYRLHPVGAGSQTWDPLHEQHLLLTTEPSHSFKQTVVGSWGEPSCWWETRQCISHTVMCHYQLGSIAYVMAFPLLACTLVDVDKFI